MLFEQVWASIDRPLLCWLDPVLIVYSSEHPIKIRVRPLPGRLKMQLTTPIIQASADKVRVMVSLRSLCTLSFLKKSAIVNVGHRGETSINLCYLDSRFDEIVKHSKIMNQLISFPVLLTFHKHAISYFCTRVLPFIKVLLMLPSVAPF